MLLSFMTGLAVPNGYKKGVPVHTYILYYIKTDLSNNFFVFFRFSEEKIEFFS